MASRDTTAMDRSAVTPMVVKEMSTDFKCRYKELTWVQKGIGKGGNLDYKAEFKSLKNRTIKGPHKKRQSEAANQQRSHTLGPLKGQK